jgi:uncharacterized protein (DUF488 family)
MKKFNRKEVIIYTVGHSNRTFEQLLQIVQQFDIHILADVRRYPTSPRFTHFNAGVLKAALNEKGISYLWLGDYLGAFRPEGFENYMQSEQFGAGIIQLKELAQRMPTAIFCSERNYAVCHRLQIASVLTDANFSVWHILEIDKSIEHRQAMLQLRADSGNQLGLF